MGIDAQSVEILNEVGGSVVDLRSAGQEISAVDFQMNGIAKIEVIAVRDIKYLLELGVKWS